jgi:hypothetical protein
MAGRPWEAKAGAKAGLGRISPWSRLPPGSVWREKIIQNPARRNEDFDRKSPAKGEALHEMAGETGGLDKSTHTRIEERRCGYEHFSSPGLTVEKNFGRTELMKTSVPLLPGFP